MIVYLRDLTSCLTFIICSSLLVAGPWQLLLVQFAARLEDFGSPNNGGNCRVDRRISVGNMDVLVGEESSLHPWSLFWLCLIWWLV